MYAHIVLFFLGIIGIPLLTFTGSGSSWEGSSKGGFGGGSSEDGGFSGGGGSSRSF